MAGEMIEMPGNTFGLALNLERDSVGAVVLGDYEHLREGDTVKTTGRILEVPIGREPARPRRQRAGPADRRQGPDQRQADRADRESRARRDLAQVGFAAGADRLQVGRRDDPDRPRPARADHRRPPDRQDRARRSTRSSIRRAPASKCIYVAIGQKQSSIANVVRKLEEHRRDGAHHHRRRLGVRIGRDAVHRAVLRLRDGRVLPRQRRRRADHLRRPDQAGLGLSPDFAAAAPPAGPRSLSGRRVLSAFAPARARRARQRGVRRKVHRRARSRARPAR